MTQKRTQTESANADAPVKCARMGASTRAVNRAVSSESDLSDIEQDDDFVVIPANGNVPAATSTAQTDLAANELTTPTDAAGNTTVIVTSDNLTTTVPQLTTATAPVPTAAALFDPNITVQQATVPTAQQETATVPMPSSAALFDPEVIVQQASVPTASVPLVGGVGPTVSTNVTLVDSNSTNSGLPPFAGAVDPTVQLLVNAGMHPAAIAGLDPLVLKSLFNLIRPAQAAAVPANALATGSTIDFVQSNGAVNVTMNPAPGNNTVAGAAHSPAPPVAVVNEADNAADKAKVLGELIELGVSVARVRRWALGELKRLRVLLMWADDARRIYAIDWAPNEKDWGVPSAFDDQSNTLCIAGSSSPLNFWVVGEITSQWWVDSDGMPAPRPAISIQPMKDSIPDYCKTLLNELCRPANSFGAQFGPSQIKASRWMNTRAAKGQPATTHEFKAVFDARMALRDKSPLQQLHVGQLAIRDIVVLEFRIGRYPVKQEGGTDFKGKKRAMDRWQAFFDLQAIYKLKDVLYPIQYPAHFS
ncbi:hypothetical protein DFH06DRAFT_1326714 [Mycena polygramma]|nr:hypothetical protein DFH06DRAFT_1326714 [Mycena polygramma]